MGSLSKQESSKQSKKRSRTTVAVHTARRKIAGGNADPPYVDPDDTYAPYFED